MNQELKENKFWKLRGKKGRERLFAGADTLLDEAQKYFEFCDANPWHKAELMKYQGVSTIENVPLPRAYTMDGLCKFLGVSGSYFRSAKYSLIEKTEKKTASLSELNLLEAIELIEQAIRSQQIEGAAIGIFSSNLVARINGLADIQNVTNTRPMINISVRDHETADNLNQLDQALL